jgi:hypothetical protein
VGDLIAAVNGCTVLDMVSAATMLRQVRVRVRVRG